MRPHLSIAILLAGLSFFLPPATAQLSIDFTEVETRENWEAVLQQAQREDKLVFVELYADWCGFCKKMRQEVYPDEAVAALYNGSFINVSVDGEKGYGRTINRENEITGFPSFLILDGAGQVINSEEGYQEVEEFINFAERSQQFWERYPELAGKCETGDCDVDEVTEYASILSSRGDTDATDRIVKGYLEKRTLEELNYYKPWKLITSIALEEDDKTLHRVLDNIQQFILIRGEEEVLDYLTDVIFYNTGLATQNGNEDLMEQTLTRIMPILREDLGQDVPAHAIDKIELDTRLTYFAETEGWDKYIAAIDSYLEKHQQDNPEAASEYALKVTDYEVPALLDAAIGWSKAAMEQSPLFENELLHVLLLAQAERTDEAITVLETLETKYADDFFKLAKIEEVMEYLKEDR